jgi:uncharacterized membrane protein
MKKLLLIAFVFSLVGTGAELLLLEHFEGWKQLIPLIVIGLGLLSIAWLAYRPSMGSTYFFRGVMICFMVSGLLGFALHYNGNMAFELEMYPSLKGTTLIWETLKGATPVLAPGSMAATGLFGWAYSLS